MRESEISYFLKKFLPIALGGLLGITLYGIGEYLITGHTGIGHLITYFIIFLIAGAIGTSVTIKLFDL